MDDHFMTEKQSLALWAVVKAIFTTMIIGLSINRMDILRTTTDTSTFVLTSASITIISFIGIFLYQKELRTKGAKYAKHFFYMTGISWDENAGFLVNSWIIGAAVTCIIIISALSGTNADVGYAPGIIAVISGVLFTYIFRNKSKKPMDHFIHFAEGYAFGFGMIILGIVIVFLMSIFGVLWISLLIGIDAIFTGVYGYIDLLDWERDQKKNIEKAKSEAGLV